MQPQQRPSLDSLISPEREYLEKVYIDYLRCQYPTLEQFRGFASRNFEEKSYVVEDRTLKWPRDVRLCLIDFLRLPDISALCRTSKAWYAIISEPSFNGYWHSRYRREHYNQPPTKKLPDKVIQYEMVKTGNRRQRQVKLQARVLWFDAYQYIEHVQHGRGYPMRQRAFRTFLERKKNVSIKQVGFPCIENMRYWSLRDRRVPISLFPKWVFSYLPPKFITGLVSANMIGREIANYCFSNCSKVFCSNVRIEFINNHVQNREPIAVYRHANLGQPLTMRPHEYFQPGPLRDMFVRIPVHQTLQGLLPNDISYRISVFISPTCQSVIDGYWSLQTSK